MQILPDSISWVRLVLVRFCIESLMGFKDKRELFTVLIKFSKL